MVFDLSGQEMKLIFPNSQRINRGNYEIKQLMDACRSNNVTDFVMLRETRGVPGTFLLLDVIDLQAISLLSN